MPGINGLETFKAVKDIDPEIVGTIVTAFGTLNTAVDALKLGFKGFLTKPFTCEELLFTVSETLRQSRLEKEVIAYKQAAKLKDDFLALISHELRTPLSLILSSTNLLNELRIHKAEGEEKNLLSILRKEGNRLGKLITDLLIMTELDLKEYEAPPDRLNLREIAAKTVNSLEDDAQETGVSVYNLIPEDLSHVSGVKSKIVQLFINLIDNAIRYNRKGGEVKISACEADGWLQVAVEDTGLGISEEKIEKLFNPFHPLEDPLTKVTGGIGLGLPVSKKIVDAHGGKLMIVSEPGKGSKVSFTLPLKR
jgi:signal transduction histidine kinase